ncbi:phosphatidylserine decarboxylase [Alienimonas sp. DA493]|uniref:phosphatidylserine decarboxylase n=1 Tax=Alienimonas sp. DA493 TaxID=3373605 RepID=UPI0037547C70
MESLPPEFVNIQPGGGRVMSLELAWGHVRRWYLRTFRPKYVKRMAACRKGERNPAPHDVLDPRDVKFYENQPGGWHWDAENDPFTWRNHLGFARWGLAELLVFSAMWFAPIVLWACIYAGRDGFDVTEYWDGKITFESVLFWFAVISLVPGALCVWFFRDPPRTIPDEPGVVVSPADGTIAEIAKLDYHPFLEGPAVRVGIFLSIFNVHVNRWPQAARVVGIDYHPGKYLDARDPASVTENEQAHLRLETTDPADGPPRRMVLHAIAGAVARRIVCVLKPGDVKPRGAKIGMIKLGSRTELLMPDEPGLTVRVKVGQKVLGGKTELAAYMVNDTLPGEATDTFPPLTTRMPTAPQESPAAGTTEEPPAPGAPR